MQIAVSSEVDIETQKEKRGSQDQEPDIDNHAKTVPCEVEIKKELDLDKSPTGYRRLWFRRRYSFWPH